MRWTVVIASVWALGTGVGMAKTAPKSVVVKKASVAAVKPHARGQAKKTSMRTAATRVAYKRPVVRQSMPVVSHGAGALALKSNVALVVDEDTNEVLYRKNDQAVLPIASITKLMTGLLITEARLSMDEPIAITQDDVDTEKGTSSRLSVGAVLTRGELLHLALMSSENRAAHALGRTYPGGLAAFVGLMNAKARALGMADTHYVEPTGLSSRNRSSARDLAVLVKVASDDATLRALSTSPGHQIEVGQRTLQFNNTNRLVKNPDWDIVLQKTGYISEAGQCLVMQARLAGRNIIMVFLDAAGKLTRIADAQRVRKWVEAGPVGTGLKLSAAQPTPDLQFDRAIALN
ncbi:MAG: D-alanyl-D-alanine endopeptidase [Rhodoferax sp.]